MVWVDHIAVEPETVLLFEVFQCLRKEGAGRLVSSGCNDHVTRLLLPISKDDGLLLDLLDFTNLGFDFSCIAKGHKIRVRYDAMASPEVRNESLFRDASFMQPELIFENRPHK